MLRRSEVGSIHGAAGCGGRWSHGTAEIRLRQGSGHGGILVREMDNVVRGDADINSLIVIVGRDLYMITEGAPGTGIRSGRTSGGDRLVEEPREERLQVGGPELRY